MRIFLREKHLDSPEAEGALARLFERAKNDRFSADRPFDRTWLQGISGGPTLESEWKELCGGDIQKLDSLFAILAQEWEGELTGEASVSNEEEPKEDAMDELEAAEEEETQEEDDEASTLEGEEAKEDAEGEENLEKSEADTEEEQEEETSEEERGEATETGKDDEELSGVPLQGEDLQEYGVATGEEGISEAAEDLSILEVTREPAAQRR